MSGAVFRRELRQLFRLAAPLAAAQAGTQLMTVVDIAVLGRVGALEIGAAGLGNAIFFSFSVIGMGLVFGIDPIISQAIGAGEHVRAREALWQGIWLALCVSGVLTIPIALAPLMLPIAGVQPELIAPTTAFLLIRVISLAPFLLFLVLRAYLQAHGITRPMLMAMVGANIFNFFGDLLFVFGGSNLPAWCGPLRNVPAMGVAGAALSTTIATFLEVLVLIPATRRLRIGLDLGAHIHRWNGRAVAQAVRVGLPVGVQMGAEIGIFAMVGVLAGRLGSIELAAHQLVLGMASFTYTIALGVSAAASVRVGLAVGASDGLATRAAGRAAFAGGAAVMIVNAAIFAIFPGPLVRAFTDQTAVIAVAVPLFVVAAYFQISDGVQAVGAGALRGAGDTRFTLGANLIGHWLIGMPVAMFLGFHLGMGITGLWWGLCAGLTVVAVMLFIRFERLTSRDVQRLE